jgi:hypothetical protein
MIIEGRLKGKVEGWMLERTWDAKVVLVMALL